MARPQEPLVRRAEQRGVRLSESRKQVLAAVEALPQPFSAGELVAAVARTAPSVGRATVFRTLLALTAADLLERVRMADGADAYVAGHRGGHHHHLICRDCGDVLVVEHCPVAEAADAIARAHGFAIESHAFEIFGVCQSCRCGS
ncbi:MAG TPA: transcriptional repressor [Limnochordia bacterium]|nr:transcriptional repressor [Limnochordia bacterium]